MVKCDFCNKEGFWWRSRATLLFFCYDCGDKIVKPFYKKLDENYYDSYRQREYTEKDEEKERYWLYERFEFIRENKKFRCSDCKKKKKINRLYDENIKWMICKKCNQKRIEEDSDLEF